MATISTTTTNSTDDVIVHIYNEVVKLLPSYVLALSEDFVYHPWLFAFLGSMLVGLSGIFPLLIIPIDDKKAFENNVEAPSLKVLLSFAVGALLADVFLHLLPEAWEHAKVDGHLSMKCGLWVLCGLLLFIIVEKIFSESEFVVDKDECEDDEEDDNDDELNEKKNSPINPKFDIEEIDKFISAEMKKREKQLGAGLNGGAVMSDAKDELLLQESCLFNNNTVGSTGTCSIAADGQSIICGGASSSRRGRCLKGRWLERIKQTSLKKLKSHEKEQKSKHISGYLNLLANAIDNFTHGLAVGGSFLVSFRVGCLSTFAILVHEIPHEVGDFAILLRSGFSRWEAAKAQLATATGGLIGALAAVLFSGASNTLEAKTSWILPFTAGGFLHIALITVLPDLLKEENPLESLKQLGALLLGIVIMGTLTYYLD